MLSQVGIERIFFALVMLLWSALAVGQHTETVGAYSSVSEVRSAFEEIDNRYINVERSAQNDSLAFHDALQILQDIDSDEYVAVATEAIHGIFDLSPSLPNRRILLDRTADRMYSLVVRDTTTARRVSFIRAMSVLELKRSDFKAGILWADSILTIQQNSIVAEESKAGNYMIRGFCNEALGKLDEAQQDFSTAAKIYTALGGHETEVVLLLEGSARINMALGDIGVAYTDIIQAEADLKKFKVKGGIFSEDYRVFIVKARILFELGRTDEAFESAENGLQLAAKRGDPMLIAKCNYALGDMYLLMDNPKKSLFYFDKSIETYSAKYDPDEFVTALRQKGHALSLLGEYRAAYEIRLEAAPISDSLVKATEAARILNFKSSNASRIVSQKMEVVDADARAEAATLKLDQTQRAGIILGLLGVVSLLVFLVYSLHRKRREKAVLEDTVTARTAELELQKEELIKQADRLKKSNEELERFAYIASHDLKTPIRNVTSFLSLIKRRRASNTATEDELDEYVDMSIQYASQMQNIVSDILEFSRVDLNIETVSSEVDLFALADTIRTQLRPDLESRTGSIEISGKATIVAPEGYVSQLLRNIIENGIKYNDSLFPRIQIEIDQKGDFVNIAITDNGIGVEEHYFDQIFEMFKRLHTTDKFEGTGLGLAVCKKVVERLGGSIFIESELGEGSTFTLVLPLDCTRDHSFTDMETEHDMA